MSRLPARLIVPPLALLQSLVRLFTGKGRHEFPVSPSSILILHSMLLGDSLYLYSLVAKARERYPDARIVVSVPRPLLPLFACRPAGVEAIVFNPREFSTVWSILRSGPYDLALVPAENRHTWLARAAGASHIVAFAGDVPAWKNWMVDTAVPLPERPMAIGDMFTTLLPGDAPKPFDLGDWPIPEPLDLKVVPQNQVVLHVTSSMRTKEWLPSAWFDLALRLASAGLSPCWSIGPGEEKLLSSIDSKNVFPVMNEKFLPTLHILARSSVLVSVDTSMVHLARLAGVPTVVLFGPTHPELFGGGRFWQNAPFSPIFREDVPCRDDGKIFRRSSSWARICTRGLDDCPNPYCIRELSVDQVEKAVLELIQSVNHHV